MKELFLQIPALIVFLHVFSAIIWIGGMITIRFVIHSSMQTITDPSIKLSLTLLNLNKFFNFLIPVIALLLITAIILIFGLDLNTSSLVNEVRLKELILTAMFIVFVIVYIKRNKAQKAFNEKNLLLCKQCLEPIAKIYVPLNIILGLVALYLGVVLRGF